MENSSTMLEPITKIIIICAHERVCHSSLRKRRGSAGDVENLFQTCLLNRSANALYYIDKYIDENEKKVIEIEQILALYSTYCPEMSLLLKYCHEILEIRRRLCCFFLFLRRASQKNQNGNNLNPMMQDITNPRSRPETFFPRCFNRFLFLFSLEWNPGSLWDWIL